MCVGVCKTSTVTRYVEKHFNQQIAPTVGASFVTCKIEKDDKVVTLQVRRYLYTFFQNPFFVLTFFKNQFTYLISEDLFLLVTVFIMYDTQFNHKFYSIIIIIYILVIHEYNEIEFSYKTLMIVGVR